MDMIIFEVWTNWNQKPKLSVMHEGKQWNDKNVFGFFESMHDTIGTSYWPSFCTSIFKARFFLGYVERQNKIVSVSNLIVEHSSHSFVLFHLCSWLAIISLLLFPSPNHHSIFFSSFLSVCAIFFFCNGRSVLIDFDQQQHLLYSNELFTDDRLLKIFSLAMWSLKYIFARYLGRHLRWE